MFVSAGGLMADNAPITLLPDEKVLWEGRPGQGLLLQPNDAFLIPFSLFWTGSVFRMAIPLTPGRAPSTFDLFLLLFMAFGIYLTVGRFFADAWIRSRMVYLVTNERVIIVTGRGKVTSLDIKRLPALEFRRRFGDRGTIRFGAGRGLTSLFANRGLSSWQPSSDPTPQFLNIADARMVYDLVQAQARDDRTPAQAPFLSGVPRRY